MTTPISLVTIDATNIGNLLKNAQLISAFPFLTSLVRSSSTRPGCGRCGRRAVATVADAGIVLQQLAGLPGPQKLQLKQLLHTERIELRYRDISGRKIRLCF